MIKSEAKFTHFSKHLNAKFSQISILIVIQLDLKFNRLKINRSKFG